MTSGRTSLSGLEDPPTHVNAGYKANCWHLQYLAMGTSSVRPGGGLGGGDADAIQALQEATRVLTGVALRSLEVLDGAVTLPQFRMLAVLADLGRARSVQVAGALGLTASTVTRLADRLVTAGHVARGTEPGHRSVVTLELTASGQRLVDEVATWRQEELARVLRLLSPEARVQLTASLCQLVSAVGEGYGLIARSLVPAWLAQETTI